MTDTREYRAYSPRQVERLLQNYLSFRSSQITPSASSNESQVEYWTYVTPGHERPLGYTPKQSPYPFMVPKNASSPINGKQKARQLEDIVVSMCDLEESLPSLSDDYLELIYKHYLFQSHTIQDLCTEQNTTSRGSMRNKCFRALRALTSHMNGEDERAHK
jgi:hypothetical protein